MTTVAEADEPYLSTFAQFGECLTTDELAVGLTHELTEEWIQHALAQGYIESRGGRWCITAAGRAYHAELHAARSVFTDEIVVEPGPVWRALRKLLRPGRGP